MKGKMFVAAAAAMMMMAGVSCTSSKSAVSYKSFDGTWKITTLDGKTMTQDEDGAPSITFMPSEKRFSCKTGCNMVGGSYQVTKEGVTLTPGMQTMMACPDMSVEETIKSVLPTVTNVTASAGGYTFTNANGATVMTIAK